MKSAVIFIVTLIGLSLLVSVLMVVTAMMKPEWFVPKVNPAIADSLQTQGAKDSSAVKDSARALPGEHAQANAGEIVPEKALIPTETKPASPVKSNDTNTVAALLPPVDTAAKAEDLKNLVKLYEAMKPQAAARILGKMQDKEIRNIILHLKKKQAAQILANFDATRAAQILAQ